MAISVVSSPAALVPAYEKDALLYRWKEAFAVTASANNGGDLQLTVGASATAEISVNDYVYVSGLANQDNVETPILRVKTVGATTITLDFSFQSVSSGEIRLMRERTFICETGYSGQSEQPIRESLNVDITPNPDGIYELDVFKAVVSRFTFSEPNESNGFAHNVQHRAYQEGIGTKPAFKTGLKQNTGIDIQVNTINYIGLQGIITDLTAIDLYQTYLEDPQGEFVSPGRLEKFYLTGQVINLKFNTHIADIYTTVTPSLPAYITFTSSNSGQTLTGLKIDLTGITADTTFDTIIEENDGLNPPVTYVCSFSFFAALESRTPCVSKSLMLCWWAPGAGWKQYSFELLKEYELTDNKAQLVQSSGERFVANYEDQYEAITLYAKPEREAILDYLNSMFQSTEIFIVNYAGTKIDSFDRVYLEGGNKRLKGINQYRPNQNRFQVTIYKSAEIRAINQD